MAQELDPQDTEQTEVDAAEEKRRDRRKSPWPWIALFILILIILWLLWRYFGWDTGGRRGLTEPGRTTQVESPSGIAPEPVQPPAKPNQLQPLVPDVIGMTKGEAIAAIGAAGFKPLVSELYGTRHPANRVYHQNPSGGAMLTEGGTVVIQVQQLRPSVPTYVMPRLTGRSKSSALSRLSALGISPTISYAPVRGALKAGTVNSQWPRAGAAVKRGGDVQIEVLVNP